MITLDKIRKSYDTYAQNYDSGTELQRSLADKLINIVEGDGIEFSKILDVGCGTGYLTSRLNAIGCDISFGMLSRAKDASRGTARRAPTFIQSDACYLPFVTGSFDLVVSNAAYQWVPDLKIAFKDVKRVLRQKGKFYFVVFNKNTLWQLQEACREIGLNAASENFPNRNRLYEALFRTGFKIDSIETFCYEKYYTDLWDLLGTLKKIGSTSAQNNNIKGLSWRRVLQQINNLYLEKFGNENGIPATYEAFLIKAGYA